MLFHYPQIDEVFDPNKTEDSFIFSNAIKVTPVLVSMPLSSGLVNTVNSYFPYGKWVNLDSYHIIDMKEKPGGWFELQVPMDDGATVMKHLMPGKLIP